jgi:hypothetical protein
MRNDILNPTHEVYTALDSAYQFFNARLFEGELPGCLITLTRKKGAHGYFWAGQAKKGDLVADEIALNPHTMSRDPKEVLSTLIHEMVHLRQQHFGKPSKDGYHNREWVRMMEEVGLEAVSQDNDKGTGKKVTHRITPDGEADIALDDFLARPEAAGMGWFLMAPARAAKKLDLSKTPHVCPECGAKAWAKLGTRLFCGNHVEHTGADDVEMEPDPDFVAYAAEK